MNVEVSKTNLSTMLLGSIYKVFAFIYWSQV